MSSVFTPKQVAEAIGVSESSLKRWCDKGLLSTVKTCGGHRRIALSGVLEFVRREGQHLANPGLLGLTLPSGVVHSQPPRSSEELVEVVFKSLTQGDEQGVRGLLLQLFGTGWSVARLGDEILAPVLWKIGEAWECSSLEIYEERRSCLIVGQVLRELRALVTPAEPKASKAIGGTLAGDNYDLANALVEVALLEQGWAAQSLGTLLPAETFCKAIRTIRPQMVWISVSALPNERSFVAAFQEIAQVARSLQIPLVTGGQALTLETRRQLPWAIYCESLRHLSEFVGK